MAKRQFSEEKHIEVEFSKRTNQLIALTALILAICSTFASLKTGAFASRSILEQAQASNSWAYYQAKSLKENTYQVQLEELEFEAVDADPEMLEARKRKYQSIIDRYEKEQDEIAAQAKEHEAARDHFLELNAGFAGALTYLQIAILLTSLATLMKQIFFWYAGMIFGGFGMYNFFATMMIVGSE